MCLASQASFFVSSVSPTFPQAFFFMSFYYFFFGLEDFHLAS